MAWNPDSGDALSADAIRVADVEGTAMKLWAEFLGGWLDGGSHVLRGVAATMPNLQTGGLTFQEQPLPTMDGLCLHVVTARPGRALKRLWADGIWYITESVRVDFQFRALVKTPRADRHNSISLVRWGANTLFAILQSSILTAALSRKGMNAFVPSPPKLVSSLSASRLLSCEVTYTYSNQETIADSTGVPAPVVLDGDAPDGTVYLGADLEVRVTPSGWEIKRDGNWYRITIEFLQGDNGLVPTTDVQLVE